MKVTSSKPKGQRFFKSTNFIHSGYKTKRPFWIEPESGNWLFSLETGQWSQECSIEGGKTTSYYAMSNDGFNDVYSLKAAKRLIAKWDVPKGTKFRASLPFVGYDFFLIKP